MMASRTSGQKTRLPPLCRALRIILLHLKRLATLRQMEMYFSTVWVVMHEAPITPTRGFRGIGLQVPRRAKGSFSPVG